MVLDMKSSKYAEPFDKIASEEYAFEDRRKIEANLFLTCVLVNVYLLSPRCVLASVK
jgi:hypothetical protein